MVLRGPKDRKGLKVPRELLKPLKVPRARLVAKDHRVHKAQGVREVAPKVHRAPKVQRAAKDLKEAKVLRV